MTQVRVGWRAYVNPFTPEDPGTPNTIDQDVTNFIFAAGISDSVQTSAIETLVSDLKAYGLWTKMKAIYPFVGGTAASHKWNLKDPRNLDAAYRLVFNGGWVHSSNGSLPNGTTGYADSKYNPYINGQLNSAHISYYSRTNSSPSNAIDMGALSAAPGNYHHMHIRYTGDLMFGLLNTSSAVSVSNNISQGLFISSRINNTNVSLYRNNSNIGNVSLNSSTQPSNNIYIGAGNITNSPQQYSSKESSFISIGDGLTDTEALNFYISVQKFQTTLGRHVGTPYVSDPDAIAFLMAAGITDSTQAAAINTLVIRMKADGVWTKMKAIYPFVGGSATSHKWNLKDPRDLDAAFRLVFNGGWTHTGTGAKPNGTTGYANTYLNPSSDLLSNSGFGWYSITNNNTTSSEMGALYYDMPSTNNVRSFQVARNSGTIYVGVNSQDFQTFTDNDTRGFYQAYRTDSSTVKTLKNTTLYTASLPYYPMVSMYCYIGARNERYIPQVFSDKCLSFAYFQSNFTDNDATALYNTVQEFQTTLGRQTDIPKVSDTDAQAFLNAANITSFQQASAVNKLVVDLKAAGVWTKMKAIYPFVGGSAASHKWNLKDPRDLDAAFRLVFNGGWTHTATGALPNGTTGYARTFLIPKTTFGRNISNTGDNALIHVSKYSRTNQTITSNYWLEGVYSLKTGGGTNGFNPADLVFLNHSFSTQYQGSSSTTIGGVDPNASLYGFSNNTQGYFLFTRTSNNMFRAFRNNNLVGTNTYDVTTSVETPQTEYLLGARNDSWNNHFNPFGYNPLENSFTSIGDGLTDAESSALYTAVETYQTSLGRGVNTPIYNNGLVLNLDAGNANSYPGTGTTWFDLASGNNGTLVNGPTYDFNNGGSLYFDGTNKYTDISYTKINITNKLTINAWVYFLSQPSTSGNPNIVDKWDWPNNKRAFSLGTENGYLSTSISYDGLFDNRIVCSDNSSIILNQWINITITYDGRTLKLYKNGSLIQSSSFSQDRNIFSDITTNIFLGRSRGSEGISRHVNARISGVQIYSNSITPTEILNNFNSTRGRFGL